MEPNASPSRPGWHWLLLLTPSVVMLALLAVIMQFPQTGAGINALLLNLLTIPLLSVGLGIWWMRHEEDVAARIVIGVLFGVAIALVNFLIAFAGCSIGGLK